MSQEFRRSAEAALLEGRLPDVSAALVNAVKAEPGDPSLRSFLFQFSAVVGDWARARKQLDVVGKLKPEAADFVEDYAVAIAAEHVREAVWSGRIAPPVFGTPRPWVALLAEALKREAEGDADAASDLRIAGLEIAPRLSGNANGKPFQIFHDSDNRLGPLLELVINGEYHWLSLEDVASLTFEAPKDLRDKVWSVGILTLTNGGTLPVFVPTRYPGAADDDDPMIALAKKTDWVSLGKGVEAGLGQRVFATDHEDIALLDLRELSFSHGVQAIAEGSVVAEDASE